LEQLEQFRQHTRQWLEANCPQSMRKPVTDMERDHFWGGRHPKYSGDDQRVWFERMRDKGWLCPSWAKEYGGAGLSPAEANVLKEELRRIHARPPYVNLGIWMVGPAILEFGTEEQKLEHLPKIARGEIRWCQGYSEPGAGSDLASLQCKAVRAGDEFVVNGTKIWTSYANHSDWIYCLVRSNPTAPKRDGITFLLFDMTTPGVSTKPIILTNGEAHFCQTFLDNVHVPVANVLGQIDKGWTVAKRVLQHERAMMSEMEDSSGRPVKDKVLRDRITQHGMNARAFEITMRRVGEEFAARDPLAGMAMVIAKYQGTEEDKRKYQLLLDIMGTQGLGVEGAGFDSEELRITKQFLSTYAHTVAGGTSEVQLNIIAKQVLGLPD